VIWAFIAGAVVFAVGTFLGAAIANASKKETVSNSYHGGPR
jgi:hypothetical protein